MKLNDKKEILPLFSNAFIRIVGLNPYINRTTESGLILSSSTTNVALSQETGEIESLDQQIVFGVVMAVGEACKHLQVGDEVLFNKHSASPLPILDLGFVKIGEQNIIARIFGEGDAIAEAFEAEQRLQEEIRANAEQEKLKKFENSLMDGITPQTIKLN